MKRKTVILTPLFCCLLLCSRARADSTLFGSTGLIYNPTAQVAPQGRATVHLSYLRETPDDQRNRGINLSGAVGIAPRWEISFGVIDGQIRGPVDLDVSGAGGGLKYLWRGETDTSPAVAVGVQSVNLLKMNTAYLVLRKNLTPPQNGGRHVRGHLGVRYDRVDERRSITGNDESQLTFYGGIEAALSRRVVFKGEANTRHDGLAKAPLTATLHVAVSENVKVFGGYVRLSPDGGWIVGVSWGIGRKP
jgi:hypothetical protein